MNKKAERALSVAAIILLIYHLIVFLVPFERESVFWISYIFTIGAFFVTCGAIYMAFIRNVDAKSRFYGFPIARIGLIYGGAQLVASLGIMALGEMVDAWIPVLIYAIGMGAALIGLISVNAVVDEIQTLDKKLKTDVKLMRNLQAKVSQIASQSGEPAVAKLAEEFRYSDPVSSAAIADAEADLAAAVDELQAAFVDEDKEAVAQLCGKITALLSERNRLCKLNKS